MEVMAEWHPALPSMILSEFRSTQWVWYIYLMQVCEVLWKIIEYLLFVQEILEFDLYQLLE